MPWLAAMMVCLEVSREAMQNDDLKRHIKGWIELWKANGVDCECTSEESDNAAALAKCINQSDAELVYYVLLKKYITETIIKQEQQFPKSSEIAITENEAVYHICNVYDFMTYVWYLSGAGERNSYILSNSLGVSDNEYEIFVDELKRAHDNSIERLALNNAALYSFNENSREGVLGLWVTGEDNTTFCRGNGGNSFRVNSNANALVDELGLNMVKLHTGPGQVKALNSFLAIRIPKSLFAAGRGPFTPTIFHGKGNVYFCPNVRSRNSKGWGITIHLANLSPCRTEGYGYNIAIKRGIEIFSLNEIEYSPSLSMNDSNKRLAFVKQVEEFSSHINQE